MQAPPSRPTSSLPRMPSVLGSGLAAIRAFVGSSRPSSPTRTRPVTAASNGCASSAAAAHSIESGSHQVSSSQKATYGRSHARTPALRPAAPMLRGRVMTRVRGWRRAIASAMPSADALSTTTIGTSSSIASSFDSVRESSSQRLNVSTTMPTRSPIMLLAGDDPVRFRRKDVVVRGSRRERAKLRGITGNRFALAYAGTRIERGRVALEPKAAFTKRIDARFDRARNSAIDGILVDAPFEPREAVDERERCIACANVVGMEKPERAVNGVGHLALDDACERIGDRIVRRRFAVLVVAKSEPYGSCVEQRDRGAILVATARDDIVAFVEAAFAVPASRRSVLRCSAREHGDDERASRRDDPLPAREHSVVEVRRNEESHARIFHRA